MTTRPKESMKPTILSLEDIEAIIHDARQRGAKGIFVSAGKPGEEVLLQAVTGAGIYPVHGSGFTAHVARKDNADTARDAFVLSVGGITTGAYCFRFASFPTTAIIVSAMYADDYITTRPDTLLTEPVALADWNTLLLYLARDQHDPNTPELESLFIPVHPPYFDSAVTFSLSPSEYANNIKAAQERYGTFLFKQM